MTTTLDHIVADLQRSAAGPTPTLELMIEAAHHAGDRALLERLQERYRAEIGRGERTVIRMGPSPVLLEDGARSSPGMRAGGDRPTTIAIDKYADESMRGYFFGDDGQETGGFLFGEVARSVIHIFSAPEAGFSSFERLERGPTWLYFTRDYLESFEESWGHQAIGDWHTHPGEPDPQPSDNDRNTWAALAYQRGHAWASIILGDNGGPYWPAGAWVTTPQGRTYPTTLETED